MTDCSDVQEPKKSVFKGVAGVLLTVAKGFLIPVSLGIIGYSVSWPLGSMSCSAYGEATGHATKWVWWNCYVEDKSGDWMLKTEYQGSQIGMRLILQPEVKP